MKGIIFLLDRYRTPRTSSVSVSPPNSVKKPPRCIRSTIHLQTCESILASLRAPSLFELSNLCITSTGQGNFWVNNARAGISAAGENGYHCTYRLVGDSYQRLGWDKVWASRFEAPTVATKYDANAPYPLAPVLHSADNSYLQVS